MLLENVFDLVTEVSFDFQNQSADPLFFARGAIGQDLLCKRVHAAARLATADRAKNRDAGIKPPGGDCQPLRVVSRFRFFA